MYKNESLMDCGYFYWENGLQCVHPKQWYLDCYYYGALGGKHTPVASYGPDTYDAVSKLRQRIGEHYHRTEITQETLGQNPRSIDI